MARNDIGPGGLLVAFIAGAVAGAAVALLYAPATGEDTRDYLGQRARETILHQFTWDAALDALRSVYQEVRKRDAEGVACLQSAQ